MIRRTHNSKIPFEGGLSIGSQLPRVKSYIIGCRFTEEEQATYDEIEKELTGKGKLITEDTNRKPRWNYGIHRRLSLATAWLGFDTLEQQHNAKLKANNIKGWLGLGTPDFVLKWLSKLSPAPVRVHSHLKSADDAALALGLLLQGAPKFRALLRIVRSQVIRDQHKVLVFCQTPAVSLYLHAIFSILRVPTILISAAMSSSERSDAIDRFNENPKDPMACITTFAQTGVGYNFQHMCNHCHFAESSFNEGTEAQGLGRIVRYGCIAKVVYLFHYSVEGTFDDKRFIDNLRKAIPETLANMNQQLFEGEGDAEGSTPLVMLDWVWWDDRLMHLEDIWDDAVRETYRRMSVEERLVAMLAAFKGESVVAS